MKPRFHTLNVKDIRRETEDAISIAFLVPSELADLYKYKPGQFLTLRKTINGEDIRRSFSVCSGLQENELRVAVRVLPDGKFSGYAANQMSIGEELQVMTPTGNFTTEITEDTEKSFLFIAAGSGITPVISLIKTILHTAKKSNVTLIYGNRGFNHIIFREELESLKNKYMSNFSLMHVFSRERIGNKLQEGRLNRQKIKDIYNVFLKDINFDGGVFVCGPEPVIFDVKDFFEEIGFDHQHIHFELFISTGELNKKIISASKKDGEAGAHVKVIIDGEEISFNLKEDGMSVLDAANQAGADAPYSCKGGVCSTCKAKVIEGEVKMDKNYALEDEEVDAGYILTCQSHPISEKLIVSYDE